MTGGVRGLIVRVVLAMAFALAGYALLQAEPVTAAKKPHAGEARAQVPPGGPKVLDKPAIKPAADPMLPKTVQLGEATPQAKPPRPIAPQTPPPARTARAIASASKAAGPYVVAPIPTAPAVAVRIEPAKPAAEAPKKDSKKDETKPDAKAAAKSANKHTPPPAAAKPAAKPAAAKPAQRASLEQNKTGGR